MYKSALGALALSLSLGLATTAVSAQTQQRTASSTSAASTSASSSSSNVQTYGSQANTKEIPSNGGNPSPQGAAPAGTNSNAEAKARNDAKTVPFESRNGSVGQMKVPPPPENLKATKSNIDTATPGASTGTTKSKKRQPDEMVSVQASKPMVSTKLAWQNFVDYVTLKQGQDQIPLMMTVTNGGFQSLVLNLNGSKLATEKDFKSDKLAMQMQGALAVGDNKFIIQGYGKAGSKLSWTLETPRAVITDVKPVKDKADKITITGRNFAKTIAGDQVQIGTKWATIVSGDSKQLVVTLPAGLAGKQKITVFAGGFPSKAFEYELKAKPVVTGLDFVSAPPGQVLLIIGSGFSPSIKDNIATIGGVPAAISAATPNQLTVTIPEMPYPQWSLPVVVKIGTVESNKNILINIQSRVIPNDGAGEM